MSRRHRARIQRRLRIIVLSSLITVLSAEAAFLHFAPSRGTPSGVSAAIALPDIAAPAGLPRYSSVITADVFAATRQPLPRVLARMATPAPEEAASYRVTAIVISGDTRLALVEMPGSEQAQHIHVGDLLGGHRVIAIGNDAITIDNSGLHQDLALSHKGADSSVPGAPQLAQGTSAPERHAGPVTQADAEAMYKGFWDSKTKDIADPMRPVTKQQRPPG